MSAVLSHQAAATQTDVAARLAFQKQLQAVTNKIHATNNIDEIMLEVSADICMLFNADRLTIYAVGEDRQAIVSKVKTGLNSFKDLKLPIAEHSIAGYVALAKKTVNIKDVYDDGELRGLNANLRFLQEVDKRTGYRTKQMLVAPIVEPGTSELIGVIQIINNKTGVPIGAALSKFFGVPYEPFKPDRVKPMELLKNLKREYVEANQWLAIDDTKQGLVVLCLDPERIRSSRIASNVFPKSRLLYKVTTQKEFKETINQFYGQESITDTGNIDELLPDLEGETVDVADSRADG